MVECRALGLCSAPPSTWAAAALAAVAWVLPLLQQNNTTMIYRAAVRLGLLEPMVSGEAQLLLQMLMLLPLPQCAAIVKCSTDVASSSLFCEFT